MRFHNHLYAPTNLQTRKQSLEEIYNQLKLSMPMRKQDVIETQSNTMGVLM